MHMHAHLMLGLIRMPDIWRVLLEPRLNRFANMFMAAPVDLLTCQTAAAAAGHNVHCDVHEGWLVSCLNNVCHNASRYAIQAARYHAISLIKLGTRM